ncbi:hypothetical protein [Peribacillus butanolivorans]|uniref:Uncharacterized protein n=1 Tax=Peribacillus butanolivorans TaxID=421767 RepID=A0AAX0S7R1_9BACI|nr:hypothetical protein [Peribacillus butanolivorans]AXN41095.1 hypothetical protein DTO10_23790 [Peribacillus butanolivorans]PEJ37695.1 hypothetical protein CN689_02015 [Peribacillus butanolivorans]QNU05067.1 hypothetical protein GM240_14750 [Peribacillus butanolivorans]
MRLKFIGVALLCTYFMMNIVFTQFMVHQYYYENYVNVLIFGGLNIVVFPLALFTYKKTKNEKA